eukprot:317695_1
MMQQPKESWRSFVGCVCMFNVILLTIIMLYSINYVTDVPISSLMNQILQDNYMINKTSSVTRCKILLEGSISSSITSPFSFYANDTFEIINYFPTNKSQTIHSQVDIDNNIDRNLRIAIHQEMCSPEVLKPNVEKYGAHSTLIAHYFYNEKHDGHGHGGNLEYWKSLDNKTTFSPIYLPILWKDQFSEGFEKDILPFLLSYNQHQYSERQFMILIVHGVHTKYRRALTPFLNEKIGKNTHYKSFVKIMIGFSWNNTKGPWLNTTQYRGVLLKSKFTLCLYGNTPESHRLWESMVLGSIPIISVKNRNYFRRKCKLGYNGLLLFPNMTLKQIENNMLIWNENNWYYKDLDVNKLFYLNDTKQFVAPILLRNDYDLEAFLDFVAMNELKNTKKSYEFWNVYQQLLNQWYMDYIEYKMNQLKNIILSQLHANCSLK